MNEINKINKRYSEIMKGLNLPEDDRLWPEELMVNSDEEEVLWQEMEKLMERKTECLLLLVKEQEREMGPNVRMFIRKTG